MTVRTRPISDINDEEVSVVPFNLTERSLVVLLPKNLPEEVALQKADTVSNVLTALESNGCTKIRL